MTEYFVEFKMTGSERAFIVAGPMLLVVAQELEKDLLYAGWTARIFQVVKTYVSSD